MIVGIDPGQHGALAFFDPAKGWIVVDMPVVGNKLNAAGLRDLLTGFAVERAYLEFATTHPHDGRLGAFRYGGLWYSIQAVLSCLDIPFELINPGTWKRHYHIRRADKEKSRQLALELFPAMAGKLARKKDHGRAEAMLIAHYGAKRAP